MESALRENELGLKFGQCNYKVVSFVSFIAILAFCPAFLLAFIPCYVLYED